MVQYEIEFRVRTQSSYELSMGSSRSSKFYSGDSVCLEDDDVSSQFVDLCAMRHSEFIQTTSFIQTKTDYIITYDYDQDKQKSLEEDKIMQKKTISNSAPSHTYKKPHHYSIPFALTKLLNSYKRTPNLGSSDLLNAAYGAMFGFVIGDSIGSYLVHKSHHITQHITTALEMKGGGIFDLEPGQGTDQTELALALGWGLLECSTKDEKNKCFDHNVIAKRYLDWMESKPFDYPTLVAISFAEIRKQKIRNNGVFNLESLGKDLQKGSIRNQNQQNSMALIKMIPLTLWGLNLSSQDFVLLIREEMKFFTPNEFVIETCIVYGKILRQILKHHDHERAIFEASKWIYTYGSPRLISLWKMSQSNKQVQISSLNMNNISIPLLFALNEINKKELNFIDSLVKILLKGYNTDTNSAIVMGLVGAAIGWNRIPAYWKNIVIECNAESGRKPRNGEYCSSKIINVVPELLEKGPRKFKLSAQ